MAQMTLAPEATPEIGSSIPTAGFMTNYHDRGEGPPVLLIHGSGPGVSAWANWRLTLPELAKSGRIIAPDMVGFGYTESPVADVHNVDLWVAQLIGLLDALGLPKVSVVGNSFGGAIALHLATRYPARVARLALMGSVGVDFPLTGGLDKVWGYQPSPDAMRELIGLFAFDQSIVTDDLVDLRYRASMRADVQARFSSLFPAPRQDGIRALAVDEAALARLPHEVLLIHGRDDRIIPLSASERLHALLPNATLRVFDRCGHWVQIEQAAAFTALLRDFLFGDRN
jgi:2-hydroxymuconate-semialdehyde hydrolase